MSIKKFIKIFFKKQLITYIDVGAADNINQRWKKISNNLDFVGFEPNYDEYKKIKNINFAKFKIFNFALGELNGYKKLNILNSKFASSFLKPNFKVLKDFNNSVRFKIEKKINIKIRKLDSLKLKKADFIKIDTQGYNLKVLKGSRKTLNKLIGIEVETEFVKIYHNQDLFEDTKKFLEKNNFIFINFLNLRRWHSNEQFVYGRTIFCNSLFLKKLSNEDFKNKKIVLKYIIICLLYNNLDLAEKILKVSKLNLATKKKITIYIKYLNRKNFFIRLYVSFFNRLNKFLKKENELFPTF